MRLARLKSIFWQQNTFILLFFILLASFAWFTQAMSKMYNTEIAIPIEYSNIPNNKVPANPFPSSILLYIRGKGSDILAFRNLPKTPFVIDCSQYEFNTTLNFEAYKGKLARQYPNFQIESLYPVLVKLSFENKSVRKLPVSLRNQISTARSFKLAQIKINPDSVLVSGPASYVDTLSSWPSENIILSQLNSSFSETVPLISPPFDVIEILPKSINYELIIKEYVEKEIKLKIRLLSPPKKGQVFLYPETVAVRFQAPTDMLKSIDTSFFAATVDYKKINTGSATQTAAIEVNSLNPNITISQASPNYAEMIVLE